MFLNSQNNNTRTKNVSIVKILQIFAKKKLLEVSRKRNYSKYKELTFPEEMIFCDD